MIFFGKKIAYFFKPFAEQAKKIIVCSMTADNQTLLFKWAKKAEYRELFAEKSKVIFRRVDEFHRVDDLHAKIYIFDDRIFLSSANLTYGSLFTNLEHAIEVVDPDEKKKVLEFLEKMRRIGGR